jgi:diguanylate cyclase (GGDEF)-like protein
MVKSMKVVFAVVFTFILFYATEAQGHNMRFQSLTGSDGLPSQSVYQTYQQRNGFIWFATDRGAIRYDGKAFRSFYYSPGSNNHISNNFVVQVLEDHIGNIWLITEYGLNKIKTDGSIEQYIHDPANSNSISANWLHFIYQDSSSRIWVGSNEGLNLYRPESNDFLRINGKIKGTSYNIPVFQMLEISPDYMILGSLEGLAFFKPSEQKFILESDKNEDISDWYRSTIYKLVRSGSGKVLIGTDSNGLIEYDPISTEYKQYKAMSDTASISDNNVNSIVEEPDGTLYISHVSSGITQISPDRQTFTSIRARDFDDTSLLSDKVNHLFRDDSGLIWVATMDGVSKYSYLQKSTHLIQKQAQGGGLSGTAALNFEQLDAQHMLIGTSGGLDKLRISDQKIEVIPLLSDEQKLRFNSEVSDIAKDSKGNIWATTPSGIHQYNPEQNTVVNYFNTVDNKWGFTGYDLQTILIDSNDDIWLTGYIAVALAKFTPGLGIVKRLLDDPQHPYSKGGNYSTDSLISNKGYIWLSTTDGLYRVDPKTGLDQHIHVGKDERENIRTASIIEDESGAIWVASQGVGLAKLTIDENNQVNSTNLTTSDGLASNELLTVSLHQGLFWLTSKDQLFSYDINTRKSTIYPSLLNLTGLNFIRGAQKLIGDDLYLGTNKGLVIVDLTKIKSNLYNAPVRLTKAMSGGVSLIQGLDINNQSKKYIAHEKNNLSFSYAALDYTNPSANSYRYILEGFDDDWVEAGNRTNVAYNSLDAGTYTFKVMASNSDGKWSENIASFTFEIEQPLWFYALWALVGLLTLAALLFIFNRRLHVKSLYKKANYDSLTGVANRYYFNKTIEDLVAENDRIFTLIIVDLDGFKEVNDIYGHAVGDELLIQVAARMKKVLRDDDLLARLGGDEFAIIINKQDLDGGLINIAERLRQTIKNEYVLNEQSVRVSASIGAASFPADTQSKDALLVYADTAMFAAKESGKNAVRFFNKALSKELESRTELKQKLQSAIHNQEFDLHYQPQIDQLTNKVVGFEALIRWFQADGTSIPPNIFIPEAERNGSIVEIGRWVLFSACKQAASWQEQGFKFGKISVNVSATQITKTSLINDIEKALKENDLAPELLEIEITESVLVDNIDLTLEVLTKLRILGVSIALDDFGTGSSSLNDLTKCPIDTMKIDRSFIQSVETDPATKMVLKNIYTLANDLSMKVVAEGVETEAQLQILARFQGRIIQGYYYSPALSESDATSLLYSKSD